ncbi:stalk domain-containing protein [Ammoniphilus sp. YIM 78166]|uniref:stalk domain-containing protein n=1 Tax=Ammoniphilus sp. YIM 78166 TaxID=1644106 RepID=UPI00106F9893|nr:stalk domain-containing protein [Ammoniphilus sp. YIM 78166]
MKKRVYWIFLLVFLVIIQTSCGQLLNPLSENRDNKVNILSQASQISVYLDGKRLTFEVAPTIVNGRTLVPLRAIFESLGATVDWNGQTRTVTAAKGSTAIRLTIGQKTAFKNNQAIMLDEPAVIINGRTLVPLRFVSEAMGSTVGWNGLSRVITISSVAKQMLTVTRVVDGDTLEVNWKGKTEKIRLIGIDTPETVHPDKGVEAYGKEASNFTKAQLEGKQVLIEFDVGERDRYDRLLGYVSLTNGTFFNAELVAQGYAQIATFPPNVRWVDLFTHLQADAKNAKRGLWGVTNTPPPPTEDDSQQPSPDSGLVVSPNCPDPKIKGNLSSTGEKIYHVPEGQYYERTEAEEMFCTEKEAVEAGYRRSLR